MLALKKSRDQRIQTVRSIVMSRIHARVFGIDSLSTMQRRVVVSGGKGREHMHISDHVFKRILKSVLLTHTSPVKDRGARALF